MLAFLYSPILVMVVLSFNASRSRAKWGGFSLQWYEKLFHNTEVMQVLYMTLLIALIATAVATILGTLAAIGIHAMKSRSANMIMSISYLPMSTPDIVTGVSLMLMFVFIKVPLGYGTMLLAHIAFDTPYVLFSVLPKLRSMNVNLYEAALDLGCPPMRGVRKVILPEIMPGVVTGALLAFTMSLDDFVISYFTTNTDKNLSIIIYSAAKRGIEPTIYALSTLMFVAVLALLLIVNKRSALENVS
jgi:spermidine/putrescine transport system permease protein